MELMQLDDNGFWPQINDPDYQPEPNLLYPSTAGPTYGTIPPYVKPSRVMYHIYCHPRPGERIEHVSPPIGQGSAAGEVEDAERALGDTQGP